MAGVDPRPTDGAILLSFLLRRGRGKSARSARKIGAIQSLTITCGAGNAGGRVRPDLSHVSAVDATKTLFVVAEAEDEPPAIGSAHS